MSLSGTVATTSSGGTSAGEAPVTWAGGLPSIRTLDDATTFLYQRLGASRDGHGARAGVARARALCETLGDPQDRCRSVHVAGTAGKGSVVAFVAGLLGAHGFTVGAHLSPHAHSIVERFLLDGRAVAEHLLVRTLVDLMPGIGRIARSEHGCPTFFEVTNAIASQLFADGEADYAVVETGLGGRLDSTNTITRADKLALLTHIGLDHTEVLGDTLAEIATEKAGIMPRHGHVIALKSQCEAVDQVFVEEAAGRRCTLELFDPSDPSSPPFVERELGLPGRHQVVNAALALRAVAYLAQRDGWRIDPTAVHRGLRQVRLPGRFERRRWHGHPVVLDGAHNPIKLGSVVSVLRDEHPGQRFVWVLAFKGNKDVRAALEIIAPVASAVVATEFVTTGGDHRPAGASVPAAALAGAARRAGVPVSTDAAHPGAALQRALELSAPGRPVVAAGSFHLVAAIGDILSA